MVTPDAKRKAVADVSAVGSRFYRVFATKEGRQESLHAAGNNCAALVLRRKDEVTG